MGLTLEHIDRALKGINRLMPAKLNYRSSREYSLKECIFLMADKLLEKKDMGCTAIELAKALEAEGIAIKAPTLTRYLHEYQKTQSSKDVEPCTDDLEKESNNLLNRLDVAKSSNSLV